MNHGHSNGGQVLKCIIPECDWTYPCLFKADDYFKVVEMHMSYEHPKPDPQCVANKAAEFEAPSIDVGVDEKTWTAFALKWRQYCQCSKISEDLQSFQLFQCASKSLKSLFLRANPDIFVTNPSPKVVLEKLRQLAVVLPTSKIVARSDLRKMTQDNDEPFHTFFLRVQGRAEICCFSSKHKCQCGVESAVNYTNDVIKDIIVAGIRDESIRKSVLKTKDLDEKTLEDIIFLVEKKEMNIRRAEYNLLQDDGNSNNVTLDSTTLPSTTPITNVMAPKRRLNEEPRLINIKEENESNETDLPGSSSSSEELRSQMTSQLVFNEQSSSLHNTNEMEMNETDLAESISSAAKLRSQITSKLVANEQSKSSNEEIEENVTDLPGSSRKDVELRSQMTSRLVSDEQSSSLHGTNEMEISDINLPGSSSLDEMLRSQKASKLFADEQSKSSDEEMEENDINIPGGRSRSMTLRSKMTSRLVSDEQSSSLHDTNEMEINETSDTPGSSKAHAKPHKCPKCTRRYKNKDGLKVHMKIHDINSRYQCEYCDNKFFPTKQQYNSHMTSIHSGKKIHQCQICYRYYDLPNLISHMKSRHPYLRNKTFKCPECPKKFKLKNDLTTHMIVHDPKSRLKCDLCNKFFATTKQFEAHVRYHTRGKSHKCPTCNLCFGKLAQLKVHQSTHSKSKTFECPLWQRGRTRF